MSTEKPVIENRTFLGHPLGLFVLFFTEMWERFSYYGMRALLITYMVNYFKWEQGFSSSVYKWYTTLVYVTPIIGGFLADRYLGNTWAVIIGGVLMAVGHFLMAFEAPTIFYAALIFLMIFSAFVFFKPQGFGLLIDPLNAVPANRLQTPPEIHPLWYQAMFYSFLRD